jgi:hypothetical protein
MANWLARLLARYRLNFIKKLNKTPVACGLNISGQAKVLLKNINFEFEI